MELTWIYFSLKWGNRSWIIWTSGFVGCFTELLAEADGFIDVNFCLQDGVPWSSIACLTPSVKNLICSSSLKDNYEFFYEIIFLTKIWSFDERSQWFDENQNNLHMQLKNVFPILITRIYSLMIQHFLFYF
jgi:hypothetical protein